MISKEMKAFRDADFNSNTNPKTIGYNVGEKFDEAGLPNPYIEDQDEIDPINDPTNKGRDGRGLPTEFGVSTPAETTLTNHERPESRLAVVRQDVGEVAVDAK